MSDYLVNFAKLAVSLALVMAVSLSTFSSQALATAPCPPAIGLDDPTTPLQNDCGAVAVVSPSKHIVWVDADTANEIDDVFAIGRALKEPLFDVRGVSSAQFHKAYLPARPDTVGASQRLNTEILELMNLSNVLRPLGSNLPLANQFSARNSAAAQQIISAANAMPNGQKLEVFVLGASTNVASAILLDPNIVPKIRVHALAMTYNDANNTWSKDEFNVNNDPYANEVLLNSHGLELVVMQGNASKHLVMNKSNAESYMVGRPGILGYMIQTWHQHPFAKDRSEWIMWDIAIFEAFLDPGSATKKTVSTPSGNASRSITVYTAINPALMLQSFRQAVTQ